jgi:hypothetical protein
MYIPIDAGYINDYIYHVTAEFIGLHVYRRTVGGYIDFTDYIDQEGLLHSAVLQTVSTATAQQWSTEMRMSKRFSKVGNCGISF